MPTDCGGAERRQAVRSGGAQPHPAEPENLPCPRCDSTNTKFCYYNNYNLSQPRYFCKACRRYWTRGGTLRNVPVGGGSRKNSKRSRSASSSTTPPPPPQPFPAVAMVPSSSSEGGVMIKPEIPLPVTCDLNLNEESFTSLLAANASALQGGGFLGYGFGQSGFDEMSLGFGYGYGPSAAEGHVRENIADSGNGGHAWQLGGFDGGVGGSGGGGGGGPVNVMDGGDYFRVV